MEQKITQSQTGLPLVEFTERFITRMVSRTDVAYIKGGTPVRQYAAKVAPAYWEAKLEGFSPEDCADEDMSYWGREAVEMKKPPGFRR